MMMNIVSTITSELKRRGVESSRTNAEAMLGAVAACRRLDLYAEEIILTPRQHEMLYDMLNRRISGEPLQYIIGRVNFYGNELLIRGGVFIPRPETEILVDAVVDFVSSRRNQFGNRTPLILDLCTGSGNIAISLTKALTHCKIIGSDISEEAVLLAEENTALNGVSDRIDFILADLFDIGRRYRGSFDIIVSNPPYIPSDILDDLPLEVRYEPRQALDGGRGGLDYYRRIIDEAPYFLKSGGLLALEIGDGACGRLKGLFKQTGYYYDIEAVRDLNLKERVIRASRA